jgi:hypothetical protein
MEINPQQSKFEGWAVVNVLGHQRYAGHVTTEHFGGTVLFRVVTPAREAKTRNAEENEYLGQHGYSKKGWIVHESEKPEVVRYIGAGSIYSIEPVAQERVLSEIEEIDKRTFTVTDAEGKPLPDREEMPW